MNNIVELRLQMLRDEDEKFWHIYLQIFGSFVISFILHTPQYFQINDSIILNNNVTSLDSVLIMEQMYVYIYIVLCKALPLILILVLNICLVRKLKTIWYRRRTIKNKNVTSSLNNLENSHVQNEQRRAAWSVTNTRRFQSFTSLIEDFCINKQKFLFSTFSRCLVLNGALPLRKFSILRYMHNKQMPVFAFMEICLQ